MELTVRPTGMIDESCKVAHLTLEDLVRSWSCTAYHDIHPVDAVGDEADEFADGGATVNALLAALAKGKVIRWDGRMETYITSNNSVILAICGMEYLDRGWASDAPK